VTCSCIHATCWTLPCPALPCPALPCPATSSIDTEICSAAQAACCFAGASMPAKRQLVTTQRPFGPATACDHIANTKLAFAGLLTTRGWQSPSCTVMSQVVAAAHAHLVKRFWCCTNTARHGQDCWHASGASSSLSCTAAMLGLFVGIRCQALHISIFMAQMQMHTQTLHNVAVQKLKLQVSPEYKHTYSHILIMQHSKKLCIKFS